MRRALLSLLIATACAAPRVHEGVTETGNPQLDASVTLRARSADPSVVSVRGEGETNVESLWMAVAGVQLYPRRACEGAEVPSFVPPFVSDAAEATGRSQTGTTEATVYCGARISLDPTADPGDGPAELRGASLLMVGTSAEGLRYQLRSSLAFEIPLSRSEGNFILDRDHDRLVVGIDVAAWMDEIWIDDGVPDGSGTIVIDDTTNRELLVEFEEALLDAMDLDIEDD